MPGGAPPEAAAGAWAAKLIDIPIAGKGGATAVADSLWAFTAAQFPEKQYDGQSPNQNPSIPGHRT